jgi:hypothetical protein
MAALAPGPGGGGDEDDLYGLTLNLPPDKPVIPRPEQQQEGYYCRKCGLWKPAAEFQGKYITASGRVQQCLECRGGTLEVKKRSSSTSDPSSAKKHETRTLGYAFGMGQRAGLHQPSATHLRQPSGSHPIGQLVAQAFGHEVPPPSVPGFLQPSAAALPRAPGPALLQPPALNVPQAPPRSASQVLTQAAFQPFADNRAHSRAPSRTPARSPLSPPLGHAAIQPLNQTLAQTLLLEQGTPSRAHSASMGPPPVRGRGMARVRARAQSAGLARLSSPSPTPPPRPGRSLAMEITAREAGRASSVGSPHSPHSPHSPTFQFPALGFGPPIHPPSPTYPATPANPRSSTHRSPTYPPLPGQSPPSSGPLGTPTPAPQGHVGGAHATPQGQASTPQDPASSRDEPAYFICGACNHARAAARRSTVSSQVDFCIYCEQGMSDTSVQGQWK